MGPVLVLAERGGAGRSTCALLTLARRLGEPVVVLGGAADEASVAVLGRFGAVRVCAVDAAEMAEHPAAARVEVLVELVGRVSPVAVLVAAGRDGLEVAARLAVRLDAGILSDVVDVRAGLDGPVGIQAVVGGSHLVQSSVVRGTPIFCVRTQQVAPVPDPARPVIDNLR
ncbi:MAG TPA: electron transfer flavoprotein subunit alpha/FixB family protein, partial [Rugosimonospora sp.]|nr:electron transfer flavoprotein subunit alpha/FixB family protein [Rugosimonospora sp.]